MANFNVLEFDENKYYSYSLRCTLCKHSSVHKKCIELHDSLVISKQNCSRCTYHHSYRQHFNECLKEERQMTSKWKLEKEFEEALGHKTYNKMRNEIARNSDKGNCMEYDKYNRGDMFCEPPTNREHVYIKQDERLDKTDAKYCTNCGVKSWIFSSKEIVISKWQCEECMAWNFFDEVTKKTSKILPVKNFVSKSVDKVKEVKSRIKRPKVPQKIKSFFTWERNNGSDGDFSWIFILLTLVGYLGFFVALYDENTDMVIFKAISILLAIFMYIPLALGSIYQDGWVIPVWLFIFCNTIVVLIGGIYYLYYYLIEVLS